ncbi:hypothetical protein U879_00645 [Defluviimonas sp. 20V17]|uniref:Uncharacterized protein n=1 Tax=Allgaiera indica TaxID=765699 RepID=A0AAN4UTH4_9RHOB|nr:hypothetical protein [Allgaiera indica]KDB05634.1 hypothetical protein U879_00645 [Defluviimonas sp. 20V17]GHE04389.1 hypothetical protein GCM10008024_31440 [Allgaiera indica]SDX40969.1 hypothetical protein SAMN05444006_11571 [Allgaiera indica]
MKAALLLSGLGAVCGSFMLVTMLAVLNALGPGMPTDAPAYAHARAHDVATRHDPARDLAQGIVSAAAQPSRAEMTRIAAGG